MARPTIVVDSCIWKVYPTGRITVLWEGRDEFGLLFELGTGLRAQAPLYSLFASGIQE